MSEKKDRILLICMVLAFGLTAASVTAAGMGEYYSCRGFQTLSTVCQEIVGRNPEAEQAVVSALKAYRLGQIADPEDGRIQAYSFGPADFFREETKRTAVLAGCGILSGGALLLIAMLWRRRREDDRIHELTDYVEKVNLGMGGILPRRREDAFSGLQDEIYKTVTELFQTRDAALKARDHFADNLANIAHQIRTPITALYLTIQLMEGQKSSEYTEQIRRQLQRLTRLEEALLLLSRIDTGTLSMERKKVDVFTVLTLAADGLKELFYSAGVTLDIQEAGEVSVTADLDWTMEAVMNLLKNCMEHTPTGGKVCCTYGQNPLYTVIRIQDTGPGFASEDIPYLFERFYRGQNAKEGSIGIGLSLAKGIVEGQNGTIHAENLPGGGACFEIRFYSH